MRLLIILLLLSAPVIAADRYVSTSGNDSNPGTISQPFKTLQKCEAALLNGETCFVRAGTYQISSAPASLSGSKTIAQYGSEIIDLQLSNGTTLRFTGAASTWDSPELDLMQMLTLGRLGTTPTPNGLVYVALYVDGALKAVNMGPSLPLLLNYSLSTKGNKTSGIQIRVYQ